MGKPTGFMEYERQTARAVEPAERVKHFNEFHVPLPREKQQLQGARCMACGVPFCQSGVTLMGMTTGCPLHNLVPEWNDLVYTGNWEQAFHRLKKTNNFPEFTARVCPALCEAACTCGLHDEPVSVKENEYGIIEYAYEQGYAAPRPPRVRTGKRVAVVGSGPSGLAAADQMNKRGHTVTVYEREDRIGGLLMYGIPNMKLEKHIIHRKVEVMKAEGVEFVTGVNVGKDVKAAKLLKEYDRVLLACGASNPRDLKVPGRDAKGIYFAVDFLKMATKHLLSSGSETAEESDARPGKRTEGRTAAKAEKGTDTVALVKAEPALPFVSAKGKHVVIIGGGDTGNDCVGASIRQGALSVTQVEMMPKPPESRREDNPWPQWPKVLKTDYGQEEAIALYGQDPRIYETTVKEFIKDKNGSLKAVKLVKLEWKKDEKTGRMVSAQVEGSEKVIDAELVLIAAGFLGCERYVADAFGAALNERTNVATAEGSYATNAERVFTAGDMHRGQSLVVWAIREGREAAREVDESLMGYTNLGVN